MMLYIQYQWHNNLGDPYKWACREVKHPNFDQKIPQYLYYAKILPVLDTIQHIITKKYIYVKPSCYTFNIIV